MTDVAARPIGFDRGQALRLPKHSDHTDNAESFYRYCRRLRGVDRSVLLAADLFSGAGGMSLGLEDAGMKVVFGADFDAEALETHKHHFGGMSVGWDLGDPDRVDEVGELLRVSRIDVLAGGPPCQPFSKAGRSKMRSLVREGTRERHDQRRDLWRSYLEIIRLAQPRAVIMENVPEMALDREMFILRSIVQRLEDWGYSVEERVVDTHRYGVPQFRQRLILVALRDQLQFTWPAETSRKVTLGNAISDLPGVDPKAGWASDADRQSFRAYGGPRTDFQQEMRRHVPEAHRSRVYDHVTRRVRDDDLMAFEHLDTKTRYSELPERFKRYRDDIFDDKYKRLDADNLSRTITAHIAKDGYWYIHPRENRTLTIREAARIQTFPDHFRFAGAPTAAFRQIGNAVPPRLGRAIGEAVVQVLQQKSHTPAIASSTTRDALSSWFVRHQSDLDPWLSASSRWLAIVGETMLSDQSPHTVRSVWPILAELSTPSLLINAQDRLIEVSSWIHRQDAATRIIRLAEKLVATDQDAQLTDDDLDLLVNEGLLTRGTIDIAMIVDSVDEEPVIATTGALRVAGRFFQGTDRWLRNRNSEGRLAVAKLIGNATSSRSAQLAILEIGNRVCTPKRPDCESCPLSEWCTAAKS